MWYEKLGGRKFILSILITIGTFVGIFLSKIDDVQGVILLGGILGLYGYYNKKVKEIDPNKNYE